MGGLQKSLLTMGGLSACLTACGAPELADLEELPVRSTPQAEIPHSESDPNAPLRGSAVAIAVVTP